MNIEDFKNTYQKMKATHLDPSTSTDQSGQLNEFIKRIRSQDKEDDKYLIRNRIIPVISGLICLTIICIVSTITNPLLIAGCLLVYLGMGSVLLFFIIDLMNISGESFGLTILEFMKRKRQRLRSWKSTKKCHTFSYIVFVSGVVFLIAGNTGLTNYLKTSTNLIILISVYIAILAFSWFLGEYLYRKRYRTKHQLLIDDINELINEISSMESDQD